VVIIIVDIVLGPNKQDKKEIMLVRTGLIFATLIWNRIVKFLHSKGVLEHKKKEPKERMNKSTHVGTIFSTTDIN
jgi:hypothetical protein